MPMAARAPTESLSSNSKTYRLSCWWGSFPPRPGQPCRGWYELLVDLDTRADFRLGLSYLEG